jgi:FAD/FMN-containing dehydrogenase
MKEGWKTALSARLEPSCLMWDKESLIKYSNDLHSLSPVLEKALKDKIADCIVRPRTTEELDSIIHIACQYQVPVTPRGGGTANYGQCVPLTGGIVIDFTLLNEIYEIGDGYMRVAPGANISKMENAARQTGQELCILPTTYKKSTIAGFINGGFGGIGSVTWGTIWDGFVKEIKVKTVEESPQSYHVQGDEIVPYLHSWGTIAIFTELTIKLVPKVDWVQWAISFETWEQAAQFGYDIASNPAIKKRLASINEWPIPSYFTPLKLPKDRATIFLEIGGCCEADFLQLVKEQDGQVDIKLDAAQYHKGMGLSDFSFGHYRIWVQKIESDYTNIQLRLNNDTYINQMKKLKEAFPELLIHLEMMKKENQFFIYGSPLFRYQSEEQIKHLNQFCESIGIKVDNPHTVDIAGGGRAFRSDTLWRIKKSNDPYGLLNQNKLAPIESA